MAGLNGNATIMAYRRENGRVGVRNHVIILPVDDLSNAACEAVANNIPDAMAIPHPYGRLQFGEDLELHFRTLIGTGANPNVAACVVIGIEPQWTNQVVDGIAKGVLCPERAPEIQLGIALPGKAEAAVELNGTVAGERKRITRLSFGHPQRGFHIFLRRARFDQ